MRIVVNTRLLLSNRLEGIGWFSCETLKRITRSQPEHHFVFLFDRPFNEEFIFSDNITPLVLSPQARHPLLYWIWFEHSVKGVLKDLQPDLFLSPDGFLCLSSKVKQLPVIHDLSFEHYPEHNPFLTRNYYKRYFPKFARKATRIATVSEFSKQDIVKNYGVDASKIDVVYNGSNELYQPVDEQQKLATRKKYTGGAEYFLYVGALQPRKNIRMLLMAFDAFKKTKSSDIKLLIVGQKKWWPKETEKAYNEMRYKADVVFTRTLPPEELKNVFSSALALTYVPVFEGFGIPIVEAMYSDTPVITSNVSSMPEVAGDAALLTDPFSLDSIKGAMLLLANDTRLRASLIEKGREQRKKFSWDRSAERLWNSIEACLKAT